MYFVDVGRYSALCISSFIWTLACLLFVGEMRCELYILIKVCEVGMRNNAFSMGKGWFKTPIE